MKKKKGDVVEKVKGKDPVYQKGMERGMLLGIKYGTKRGLEFGITRTKVEIAKRMLLEQCSYDEIMKYVKLNEDEMKQLIL